MGATKELMNCISSLDTSNWIDIFSVLINAGLAYWIVRTIQDKLTNKRVLKDHFINEIKEIRVEYKNCLNNLYSNNMNPQKVIPWFKLMNIRVNDLMSILHSKYSLDKKTLEPYQNELREIITNNPDFIAQYNLEKVNFSEESRNKLIMFQQTNNQLFNNVIIGINDAD